MELDSGQVLDRLSVIPEAVVVVHEPGQVMEFDGAADLGRGPLPGRAVIVTLGPRGEAAAALQALDGRPVVLEAAAVVHEPGR